MPWQKKKSEKRLTLECGYAMLIYMRHQNMIRRSFFLTRPQLARLAAYAMALGVPAAEALRRVLDAYLPDKKP